jgi:hypothetical protein
LRFDLRSSATFRSLALLRSLRLAKLDEGHLAFRTAKPTPALPARNRPLLPGPAFAANESLIVILGYVVTKVTEQDVNPTQGSKGGIDDSLNFFGPRDVGRNRRDRAVSAQARRIADVALKI